MGRRTERAESKLRQGNQSPEKAAKLGDRKGVKDALCTDCGSWYDSSNRGEVNRHAH